MARTTLLIAAIFSLCLASVSDAHFPWLTVDEKGHVVYSFAEDPLSADPLPPTLKSPKIVGTDIDGVTASVSLGASSSKAMENRLISPEPVTAGTSVSTQVTFGEHNGMRLEYYALHQGQTDAMSGKYMCQSAHGEMDLCAGVVPTTSAVKVMVHWEGKPLTGVTARLFGSGGDIASVAESNEQGVAEFTELDLEPGRYGIMLGHQIEEDASSHYLTITFSHQPEDN